MSPFLIHGPGSHAHLIQKFFEEKYSNWTEAKYWPRFSITNWTHGQPKEVSSSKRYEFLTKVGYGFNNKISRFSHGRQFHSEFLFQYYDHLCADSLKDPVHLFGWAQVSLESINKNKRKGGKAILEHPMPHAKFWMSINQRFYEDLAIRVKPGYSRFSQRVVEKMLREYETADFVQVHSSFARNTFLSHGIPEEKILTCLLGIDPDIFPLTTKSHKPNRIDEPLKVVYVGRLELWKGVHLLLDSVSSLPKSAIELTLVGRKLPEMDDFMGKCNGNVRWVDNVDKEALSVYYYEADLAVLPSLNDAFGMVILEAMAHGVPVIASTASAGPDVITHGVDGLIVQAGDNHALTQALQWALDNRSKLHEIGFKAKTRVFKDFLNANYFERLQFNLNKSSF